VYQFAARFVASELSSLMFLRPMLAAIPSQPNAISEWSEATALDAEMQEETVYILHPTAAGGAWYFKAGLR
jgi:hypothetical protein